MVVPGSEWPAAFCTSSLQSRESGLIFCDVLSAPGRRTTQAHVTQRSKSHQVRSSRKKSALRPEHDATFFPLPTPRDLPDDTLREMLATAGRKAEAEYQETRDRLRDLLAGSDAIQILASLAYRFVVLQTLGRAKRDDDQSIGLHHLELAQALTDLSRLGQVAQSK